MSMKKKKSSRVARVLFCRLLCLCMCASANPQESWLSDFLFAVQHRGADDCRKASSRGDDGILRPLGSLAQEYYYWFWSWATAYWTWRLVFFNRNSSSGSYRSVLMTSFCKGCLLSPDAVNIFIYLFHRQVREGRGDYLSRLCLMINVCLGSAR